MRFSPALLLVLLLVNCSRQAPPSDSLLVILLPENLTGDAANGKEAAALQLALWDAFQAQPAVRPLPVAHRRDLSSVPAGLVVDGYIAPGRFRLTLSGGQVECGGSFDNCVKLLVDGVAGRAGITPRPIPSAPSLLCLAGAAAPADALACLPQAAVADPKSSLVWTRWAAAVRATEGPAAAAALLGRAPAAEMAEFDAARLRAAEAEFRQDRRAHAKALADLARLAPADRDVQLQAASEAAFLRDFSSSLALYDRLLSRFPDPAVMNQAAYVAAFSGQRAKAESLADAARAASPADPTFLDTRGEIAYFFADPAAASRFFEQAAERNVAYQGGIDLWKAAFATRQAGDLPRAKSLFDRFLTVRNQGSARNTLVLQSIWEWHGGNDSGALELISSAMQSTDRGKAAFLKALMALNQKDLSAARALARDMDEASIESAVLRSLIDDVAPPPGLPFPPEAVTALRLYLRGDNRAALTSLRAAREKMNPLVEGQWRKLDAVLQGQQPQGLLPPSPDDWLAVLLR